MNRIKLTALVVGAGLAVSACGATYERQDAIDEIVAEGVEESIAICIVDGIEGKFSIERLEGTGDLTAEEEADLGEISIECLQADSGG